MATIDAEKQTRREARERAQRESQEKLARQAAVRETRYRRQYARHREWEAQTDTLRELVPMALAVLRETLEDTTDPKQRATVALAVLRAAGLNGLEAPHKPDRMLYYEEVDPELDGDTE